MCALATNRKAVVYASWVHLELGTITAAQRTRTTTVRFPFELHINRKNTQTVEHRLLSNRHGQNEAPPHAAPGSPAVYFQPQILLLGCISEGGPRSRSRLQHLHVAGLVFRGMDGGPFLYAEVVGFESRAKRLAFCCFFWGGGILSLAGLAAGLLVHRFGWGAASAFDPFGGWWFLNFGRNLVYPNEAYYHGLFLLCLWLLIRRRFAATLAIAALMSLSHPFTGLAAALILMIQVVTDLTA